MPPIDAIPINTVTPVADAHNNPAPGRQSFASKCMNALSARLGSQLAIEGIRVLGDMASDENSGALTKLMFREDLANSRTAVHIHMMRDDEELILDEIVLPPEHDPLDMLFRAVATAANAARSWNEDTPVASKADALALRGSVLSELYPIKPAATPSRHNAGTSVARRPARITFRRPHTASPAAARQGIKRRHSSEAAKDAPGESDR